MITRRFPSTIGRVINPSPAAFTEHGFSPLGSVLGEGEVAACQAGLDDHFGPEPESTGYGVLGHNLWAKLPAFHTLMPRLAACARAALGVPEVLLFQDNLVWKPPHTRDALAWHQDFSYWPLDRPSGVTLWLTLDPATEASGCLHYLPGTHRLGERQPADFIQDAEQPTRDDLPPLDWQPRQHLAVPVPLQAGEGVVHHPLVWHMSPRNRTDGHRRGWSVTFITPDVRWEASHAPHPYNWELHPGDGGAVSGPRFPRYAG